MIAQEAPQLSEALNLLEVLETELGDIYIYDSIIMMEGKENVTMSFRTGIFILMRIISLVKTRPVVYISHRLNSYPVDPNDYKYLEMIPNLKGIAVVSYTDYGTATAKLEKRFFKKPFKNFTSLSQAQVWAQDVIDGVVIL